MSSSSSRLHPLHPGTPFFCTRVGIPACKTSKAMQVDLEVYKAWLPDHAPPGTAVQVLIRLCLLCRRIGRPGGEPPARVLTGSHRSAD